MLDEIEPYTANPAHVKPFQRPVVEGTVHVGHAAIAPAALGDGIENDRVVDTVATGIHQHRAFQSQGCLKFPEPRKRCVGRRIAASRGVRVD